MTPDPWLSALQGALQGPPGIETWDALCAVLNAAHDEAALRLALPDALAVVQRWPEDVVRLAPARWVVSISPALQLANTLRVSGFDLSPTYAENTDWFVRLMRAPELRELRSLTIVLIHDIGVALAEAAHLTRLTSLWLHSCDIALDALRSLVCAPHLRGLSELALCSTKLGEEGAAVLANAHLPRLKTLDLRGSQVGAAGMEALATSTWLAHVKHLDLSYTLLGDRGALALAASPELACLSDLMLGGNELGDAGACALAKSTSLVGLVRLNLCDNEIRDLGAEALADSSLAKLVELDLGFNPIGDEGALAFAASPTRASLAILSFHGVGVLAPETAVALLTSPHLPALRTLHILGMGVSFGVEGARALVAAPHAPSLETWNASWWKLGDEGAVVLAQWRGLEHLVSLDLSHNGIGDVGIAALLASPYLHELVSLDVSHNAIGDAGAAALAAAKLPRLRTIKLDSNRLSGA